MNINIIYFAISLIFSIVSYVDNKLNGFDIKTGNYLKNTIINFGLLYFINPFKFLGGGNNVNREQSLNFNTGLSPFS